MPSEARLKKNNRTIKRGPKKLNFGASKPGVRGGPGPLGPPLDPLVKIYFQLTTLTRLFVLLSTIE